MRILIKTFKLSSNYGCILQAYALQKVLKDMGHDVVTWDADEPFYTRMSIGHRLLSIGKQILKKYILRKRNVIIDIDRYAAKMSSISNKYTKLFVEKHIQRLIVKNLHSIDKNQFDCVIAGSDQVWRFYGSETSLKNNFLAFTEGWNVKRIAYAVSFGVDKWMMNERLTKELQVLASRFDAISVREDSGISLCRNYLKTSAIHVLDPTMLLSKGDYMSLCQEVPQSDGDLLCYILDESTSINTLIEEFANKSKLKAFYVNATVKDKNVPYDWRIQPPVEQWLRGFIDAKFVITDSFHACVFSILFNKPFICLGNTQRGMTRFDSLFSIFDLQDRLFDISQINDLEVSIRDLQNIKWEEINDKLDKMREESIKFLNKNLIN